MSSTRVRVTWIAALLVLSAACGGGDLPGAPDAGLPDAGAGDGGVQPSLPPLEEGELLPGGDTTSQVLGVGAFVQQAPNLTVTRRNAFENGLQFFQLEWVAAPGRPEADGLGPTFNAVTCLGCHASNGRGVVRLAPQADGAGMLLRLGSAQGLADPAYGDQLQPLGIAGVPGEARALRTEEPVSHMMLGGETVELVRPHYVLEGLAYGPLDPATRISPRLGQQLIGLGLLESVTEEDVLDWEDPDDADGDGISGRAGWVTAGGEPRLGRFGWKASQPDVLWQTAAAFHGDLGISSPLFPAEDCPAPQVACHTAPRGGDPEISVERLRHTAAYVRLLGVPKRREGEDATVRRGKAVFASVGCDRCHRPSYVTGEAIEPELSHQRIWPYTDLLLHDLGEALSDGRREGGAEGPEWRTAPLWGLGLVEGVSGQLRLLHDGRARSVEEAILWHGGEATASRLAYEALPAEARAQLEAFVLSL